MTDVKEILKSKGLIRLKIWHSLILLIIASLVLACAMLWIQPFDRAYVIDIISRTEGLMFFLNWLPILIIMLILFVAGLSAVASASVTAFFGIALSFVNRYKVTLRNDPLLPWDISLGGEVAGIAKSFGSNTLVKIIAAVLLYIVISVLCSLLIRGAKIRLKYRLTGFSVMIITGLLINNSLYKNAVLNSELYVMGNVYNQVATFNSKGFLYSFIYSYNTNKISKPDNYDSRAVIEKINSFSSPVSYSVQKKARPHIIMVMGEAFSEFSLNPHFDFTGFDDPLYNYKKIKEDSYYGQIIVPNVGGGTADTEFDMLTGLSTRHFRGASFAFRLIGEEFDSIAHSLNNLGYNSEFMHPGYRWFYNRQNVYSYMGFEKMVFLEDFGGAEEKGMYITEDATIERIIEMFENNLNENPDTPYFQYCVTIQNHGPYKDKYRAETNFLTDLNLNADDINAISNYYEGLQDADRKLKRLTDYFESVNEPVVLLYFGDHLPAFTSDVYNIFYPEEYGANDMNTLTRLHKTPFIIWENSEAKALELNGRSFEEKSENYLFTSNYLGAFLLEYLGFENTSPFIDHLNELRKEFPIVLEYHSFTPEGISSTALNDEQRKNLVLYRNWEVYKVFDE